MSSVHYELCSTAGLQAVTDTPDGAAATLVRHLSEVGSLGAVDWMITGPQGRIHHGRFEALPHLPPGATIINTASIVAEDPPAQLLDYASTKAAIIAFTQSLAKQLADKGIRVNAIAPGPFWTLLQPSGGQMPEELPKFGADSPLKRPGQPAEIAPLYVQLASADSSYVSGNVFGSTGGRPFG